MIPFGLTSLMALPLPLARHATRCPDSVFAKLGSLEANADTVEAGGYAAIQTGAANLHLLGAPGRWWISLHHQSRIRQTGNLIGVQMYIASTVNMAEFWIYVWRPNGATWDLVGRENVTAKLTGGQTNTITLTTPIAVRAGDQLGYGGIGNQYTMTAITGAPDGSSRLIGGAAPTGTTDWSAQTAGDYWTPIKPLMQAPVAVVIGDSTAAGHPANYSFIEATDTTDATSDPAHLITAATGASAQNMGIGSQTSTHIAARFAADVVALKPRVCVINAGLNDIAGGATQATYVANMTAMLDACEAAGIIPVIVRLPWTNGTDEQNTTYDTWMAALRVVMAGYTNATYVDARNYVGTGTNLWDIKAAYDADGVHYNADGYAALVQAILNGRVGIT